MGVRTGGSWTVFGARPVRVSFSDLLASSSKGAPPLPSALRHCALVWVYRRAQLYLGHAGPPPPHTPASPGDGVAD